MLLPCHFFWGCLCKGGSGVLRAHCSFFVCSFYLEYLEANCKIVSEERGLEDIVLAMGRHNTDVELVESACSALWSLSMEGKIKMIILGGHPSE